jgi:hypothetical protein
MSSTTSIIQQFLHPPLGITRLEAIPNGPFSGINAFDRPRGAARVDAFGIRWLIQSFPPGYGITVGAGNNFFDRQVINIALRHQLLDSEIVVSAELESRAAAGHLLFEESFPYLVDVQCAPGITTNLWWMLAL